MFTISIRRAAACAAAAAAAALVATGCGDDGGGGEGSSATSFCDEMAEVQGDLAALGVDDPEGLDAVVERLRQVEAPDEIADAFRGVVDGYAAMADDGGLTDPDAQARLVEAQEHMTALSEYFADNCDPRAPSDS